MAAHSSILAWEIPGCRRLVAYGPWGLKTVGRDLATKQQQESASRGPTFRHPASRLPLTRHYHPHFTDVETVAQKN